MGVYPDGSTDVYFLDTPSPGFSNNGSGVISTENILIDFSHASGLYENEIDLTINSECLDCEIRFTLDGTEPTTESLLYSSEILLNKDNHFPTEYSLIPTAPEYWEVPAEGLPRMHIIRASVFRGNIKVSKTYSRSIGVFNELPSFKTVSLITEPEHLFSFETGIHVPGTHSIPGLLSSGNYYMKGKDWERPVYFEYFSKQGSLEYSSNAGARIHGVFSRQLPQKSIRLYARGEYGNSHFEHPFFEQKPSISSYKRMVLRAANPNIFHVPFKDELCHLLVKERGLDFQAFEPVVAFVNGEYWGVFNLKERHDEHYVESNYGIDADDVNMLEKQGEVVHGDNSNLFELLSFIRTTDLNNPSNYSQLQSILDTETFMEILIAQMYFELWDFPEQNNKYWNAPGIPWKWLFNDGDSAMHEYWKTKITEILINPEYSEIPFVIIARELMEVDIFKNEFKIRFLDALQTTYSAGNVISKIDSLQNIYDEEMPAHIARWKYPATMNDYHSAVDHLKRFAALRPSYLVRDVENVLGKPFTIFPNPTSDFIRLKIGNEIEGIIDFRMYDVAGRLRMEKRLDAQNLTIDVSSLEPGFYILDFVLFGVKYSEKIIIQ